MSEKDKALEPSKPVVEGLGWGGILPFLLLPVAAAVQVDPALETLLIAYGLLILAFLCGTLWMEQLLGPERSTAKVLASNLILLAAWPAIVLPLAWASALMSAGFAVHLLLDAPWRASALIGWYRRLRLRLSLVVISTLVVTLSVQIVHGP